MLFSKQVLQVELDGCNVMQVRELICNTMPGLLLRYINTLKPNHSKLVTAQVLRQLFI